MSDRRALEAGMNLFRDRATTDGFATFQDERIEAGLRQIVRRNQAVVPAADDNDALAGGRDQALPRFKSRRIMCAAFSPGAPMIPPPG